MFVKEELMKWRLSQAKDQPNISNSSPLPPSPPHNSSWEINSFLQGGKQWSTEDWIVEEGQRFFIPPNTRLLQLCLVLPWLPHDLGINFYRNSNCGSLR